MECNNGFSIAPPTIGPNGFTVVFGPPTIAPNGFQLFSMVANLWSNNGMVTIHRHGPDLAIISWWWMEQCLAVALYPTSRFDELEVWLSLYIK